MIEHPKEICNEVQSALNIGNGELKTLIISAHGNPKKIRLSSKNYLNILRLLPERCFAGIPDQTKIFLSSCSTGGDALFGLTPNIGEWLSWASNKTVYAPSGDLPKYGATLLKFTDDGEGDVDFCLSLKSYGTLCKESMLRVFSPPQTLLEQSLFYGKTGMSLMFGSFVQWQLIRLGIDIVRLPLLSCLVLYRSHRG